MKLNELKGNASVDGVLNIIKDIIDKKRDAGFKDRSFCHGQVAKAIIDQTVPDSAYIILLGAGSSVAHSLIADDTGKILIDSFKEHFVSHSGNTFTYLENGKQLDMHVIKTINISNFKNEYLK